MAKKSKPVNFERSYIVLGITVLVIGFLVSFAWELLFKTPYYGYLDGFGVSTATPLEDEAYAGEVDGYYVSVHMPDFLSANGYITVKRDLSALWGGKNDAQTLKSIVLYIYPSTFGETQYMLWVDWQENSQAGYSTMAEISFEKNADGTYNITHNFEDPTAIEYFQTYKSTVDDLIAFSEKSWTFEGYRDIEKGIKAK